MVICCHSTSDSQADSAQDVVIIETKQGHAIFDSTMPTQELSTSTERYCEKKYFKGYIKNDTNVLNQRIFFTT